MMMTVDISSIFKALGPAASIIFAAWIFMGFLQTRYDSAVDRYRALIGQYRKGDISDGRRSNLTDEILVYKRRCELMNVASVVGIVSAIILILALIFGEFALVFPHQDVAKYLAAASALIGLVLVIVASTIVILESTIIHRQLRSELMDVPELARGTGHEPGSISDEKSSENALPLQKLSKVIPGIR